METLEGPATTIFKQNVLRLEKVLIETVRGLPLKSKTTCACAKATENARFV